MNTQTMSHYELVCSRRDTTSIRYGDKIVYTVNKPPSLQGKYVGINACIAWAQHNLPGTKPFYTNQAGRWERGPNGWYKKA